jgi:hypothetical protein
VTVTREAQVQRHGHGPLGYTFLASRAHGSPRRGRTQGALARFVSELLTLAGSKCRNKRASFQQSSVLPGKSV